MHSPPPWSGLLLGSILTLFLTACPQSQSPDGKGGPAGQGGTEGAPPEMGSAAHPDDARWKVKAGEGISIQGSVSYGGEPPEGAVRIDVLTQAGEAPPHLVSAETLEGMGTFTFQAPKDFGEVHLVAFIDRTGDGPSPDDAAATTKLDITTVDITGLELVLTDEPDLGDLTPGAPPDENGQPGDAPAEGEPGEGQPSGDGPPPDGPPQGDGPPLDGEGPPSMVEGGDTPPPAVPVDPPAQ
ncbi:MAG: hypothetical protein ACI9VR_002500 [Cognaticolwellia sp.]|jgi:hypothetical protein